MLKRFHVRILPPFLAMIAPWVCVADDISVSMKGGVFSVSEVQAKLGDTLVFKNGDADTSYSIYSLSDGNSFDLKIQRPGEQARLLLQAPKHRAGTVEVGCAVHPEMKLKVTIK